VRLSKDSLLEMPLGEIPRGDKTWVRRILGIGVINLYYDTPDQKIEVYDENKYSMSIFFDDCVNQAIQPIETEFQRELCSLLPLALHCHLYVGLSDRDTPTHYIPLIRSSVNDLWRIRHRKIRTLAEASATREGVLLYWPQYKLPPSPQSAVGVQPHLRRIYTGSTSLSTFADEAQKLYETRRQLSHATLIAHWFASFHRNTIHTFQHPSGRVTFQVSPTTDGYVHPYTFLPTKIRPSATTPHKVNVVINSNVDPSLCFPQMPYHRFIAPTLKNPRIVNLPPNYMIVKELLTTGILPFVGVLDQDTNKVNFYGLHHTPPDEDHPKGQLNIALYQENRSVRFTHKLPTLYVKKLTRGIRWIPNFALLYFFKEVLLDLGDNPDMYKYRRFYLDNYILRMIFEQSSWSEFLTVCEIPLTPEEIEIIDNNHTVREDEEEDE